MLDPEDRVFREADFLPGSVEWDSFTVDPDLPLKDQMEPFSRDYMHVRFPNQCSLFIDWWATPDQEGSFFVRLCYLPPEDELQTIEQVECHTVSEIRAAALRLTEKAREFSASNFYKRGAGSP
ncbi:MAG TPA: hypothetical protein VF669_00590 [Tepidisphaeraceae bacterium]|jgi:hypothetical protein